MKIKKCQLKSTSVTAFDPNWMKLNFFTIIFNWLKI